MGTAILLRGGKLEVVPDPLRSELRTLAALAGSGGGRYVLVPAGLIYRRGPGSSGGPGKAGGEAAAPPPRARGPPGGAGGVGGRPPRPGGICPPGRGEGGGPPR